MTTDILGPARHVIGTRYVESVKPYLVELTQLASAAGPNDIITRDMKPDRIIITVDPDGVIDNICIG